MTSPVRGFHRVKIIVIAVLTIVIAGLAIPEHFSMPVAKATSGSYNPKSFWYYPWGISGTHKGVDIFARKGTAVFSSTPGLVLFCGQSKLGGNFVAVLGPKWRIHYYAHLDEITTTPFSFVDHNAMIGKVGTSGNAKGKPPHLHYAIGTLFPYVWKVDNDHQGWMKMWYLNPVDKLNTVTR